MGVIPLSSTVIVALVSAGASLAVCLINNYFQRIDSEKRHESNIMLISYRLEQLEKKVDLHNNVIERTYRLEEQSALHEEKLKVANHRLDDLEKGDDRR